MLLPVPLSVVFVSASGAWGQAPQEIPSDVDEPTLSKKDSPPATLTTDGSAVAARVGDHPIRVIDLKMALQNALRRRSVNPAASAVLQAQMLEQLIHRRLAHAELEERGETVSQADIDLAIEDLRDKLSQRNLSLDEMLKQRSTSGMEFRAQLDWELSWKQFIKRRTTDEHLQQHFESRRRQFDGSQVQVSHILLRPKASGDKQESLAIVRRAASIRQQIVSGQLSFAEAARLYSDAPSRTRGGQLDFFPRHGVMAESFSQAAFALQPGEVSEPVRSPFGIHLIHCHQFREGDKSWQQVRAELIPSLAKELFLQLAQAARQRISVEYTGVVPFIRPGTQQVVLPQKVGPQ